MRDMSAPHASRSLLWAALESGGLSVLSLAVLLIVARLIGPSELGAFAIALGAVQILTLIVEMLVHDAIIQRRELDKDHLSTAFWTTMLLGLALAVACWFGADTFANLFDNPKVGLFLAILGLGLPLSGIAIVPIARLRRGMRFKALALRSLYGRLAAALTAIALAALGYGIWALIAQHLMQLAIGTILVCHAGGWRPSFRYVPARLGELVSFGAFSLATRSLWVTSVRLFTLAVGTVLGVAAAGYLSIASRIVDTLFDLLAGAADNFALPFFSRRQDNLPSLVSAYSTATEFSTLLTQPLFGGLALCAAPLVLVLLGETWLPAVPLVQVLAVGAMLQFLVLFGQAALNALGRPALIFMVSLVSVAMVPAGFLIAPPATAFDAVVLWVSRIAVGGPLMFAVICQLLKLSPGALLQVIWRPLVATAVMALVLTLVERHFLHAQPAWIALAGLVGIGAAVYCTTFAVLGRATLQRLFLFIGAGVRGTKPV